MNVIQQLQHNRPEIVHMIDELERVMPDGTYLTSFKQNNRALSIEGLAQSNARVSAFMRNMAASEWFANPVLKIIQSDKGDVEATRKFVMSATQMSRAKAEQK